MGELTTVRPNTHAFGKPGSWTWVAYLVLYGLLLVLVATRFGLFDLDEGFYASAAAEMYRSGDYITPRYAQQPFLEKPPLLYWCIAGCTKLGLRGEIAVRMPSILAAIITLALVGGIAASRGASALAALGLGLAPLFFGLAFLAYMDMLLTLFLTAALLLFWSSVNEGPSWLRIVVGALLGFATLTKGPVAVVLFVLIVCITYWQIPSVRLGFRRYWWEALVAYLVVAAPWYYLIYKAHGAEFFQEFIIRQNLGRFGGGDVAHVAPFYFYLPVLLVGFFPWSVYLPWLALRTRGDSLYRYCWIWFWVVFVFFSISGTKLPGYILPALPPLALLLPIIPREMISSAAPSRLWIIPLTLACFLYVAGIIAATFGAHYVPFTVDGALRLTALIMCMALIVVTLIVRVVRAELAQVVAPMLLAAGLVLPLALAGVPAYYTATHADIHELAKQIAPLVRHEAGYVMYDIRPGHPSVMYYLPVQGAVSADMSEVRAHVEQGRIVITNVNNLGPMEGLGLRPLAQRGKFVALGSPRRRPTH